MNQNSFKVSIVGAGPAGLTVARILAENGIKTSVIEKEPVVGEPVRCGEGISLDKFLALVPLENPEVSNIEKLEFVDCIREKQKWFYGETGQVYSSLPTVMLNRNKFDQYLAKLARDKGCQFLLQHKAIDFTIEKDQTILKVQHSNEEFQLNSNFIIAADGPNSKLMTSIGLRDTHNIVQGLEFVFPTVFSDIMEFYYNDTKYPDGYAWVFPKKTVTNIGIVQKKGLNLTGKIDSFLHYLETKYSVNNLTKGFAIKRISGIIPKANPIPNPISDRFLAIGDATGLTNPIHYGGIAIAMHSAILASKTILTLNKRKSNFDKGSLRIYSKNLQEMPYSSPILTNAHELLFSKEKNNQFYLGKALDSLDITNVNILKKLQIVKRLLLTGLFTQPRRLMDLRTIMQGLKISKDWGY